MKPIFVSPNALSFVPVLLLHLVSLAYLLLQGPKSRQTWLFCGWIGGMAVMSATQFAARLLYVPKLSAHLVWWGGVGGVSLSILALLQFAYHYPRLRYAREARRVLYLSLCVTGGFYIWMACETLSAAPYLGLATALPPDEVFSEKVTWMIYGFDQSWYGFVKDRDLDSLVSFKVFDIWQIVSSVWVLVVWFRKTVQAASPPTGDAIRGVRSIWDAFVHPAGREARLTRRWVLLMLLSPLPVLTSALDSSGALPPGTFVIVALLVYFAILLTYMNYAPEPTTLMVKLVGISLITLLVIMGLISGYALEVYRASYDQTRRAELDHLRTLVARQRPSRAPEATTPSVSGDMPGDVLYVAARPSDGLFAPDYRMVYARPDAPDAADLERYDALLREGLARSFFPARVATIHENPWLGVNAIVGLEGDGDRIDRLRIPEDAVAYRGSAAPRSSHVVRYFFVQERTLYEVGYAYRDYLQSLHRRSLPFLVLVTGATVVILTVFPRFFRVGLVDPLGQLLAGVARVNRGDREVEVPVMVEDEIGRLTGDFNRMVASLRASEERLHALNLTLEQRVVDRTRELATLYEVAALIISTPLLDDLLGCVVAAVTEAVGGAAGMILLAAADDAALQPAAHTGLEDADLPTVSRAAAWQRVRAEQDPWLVHDLAADTKAARLLPPAFPWASLVGVPIVGNEVVPGVLVILSETPLLFNVETLGLLGAVAEQLAIAIENARLRKQAEAAVVLEERQRLARDLHDSVTQLLYSQTLFADAGVKLLRKGRTAQAETYVARIREAAMQALREMRLMIYRLRPAVLEQVGLIGALRRRLDTVEMRSHVAVNFIVEDMPALPPSMAEALYFIAEEALNNALKHAKATRISLSLLYEEQEVVMTISDDGCGFEPAGVTPGLGFHSLRERAAQMAGVLTLDSSPEGGTTVTARLPLLVKGLDDDRKAP